MTGSTAASTAPAAPNTQNVAVGLLVAEAMTKSNMASQKQLESQKEIGEEFMKQNIASAIQQIMNSTPDHSTALAQVKKFLGQLSASDSDWGSDIKSWITNELNTANSYNTPQDAVDKLNGDIQQLQNDEQALQQDQGNLDACNSKKDDLVSQLNLLKAKLDHCAWYDWLDGKAEMYSLAIAGLGIAIGGVYVAIGLCQLAVDQDKKYIGDEKDNISEDQQKIKNDPILGATLNVLASGNNVMQSQADQNVTGYKATMNNIQAFEKSLDGIIKELTANSRGGA